MENKKLIAIGEALIDFIPDKSGCEFYEVTGFMPKVGGAPANVCGAFVKLGGKASLITGLGNDPFGHKIEKELRENNIDTSCITFTDKANTALAFVSLDKNKNRTFSFYRNPSADMLLDASLIREEWFEGIYALHFCSVSLGDFPMKEAHIRAIEIADKKKALISFDPNLRFNLWKNIDELKKTVNKFIPKAHVLKVSDEELEFITGEKDTEKAIEKLFVGNVKIVLYTCGEKGAYAYTKKLKVYDKGMKVSAVDTTGAGDGFAGSFLWKLKEYNINQDNIEKIEPDILKECITFANKFSALSVTKAGAINSYPGLSEIMESGE